MPQAIASQTTATRQQALDLLFGAGQPIFALAIVAVGIETLLIARVPGHALGPRSNVVSVIPWLPGIPWIAYLFGLIWIACGAAFLAARTLRVSAFLFGALWFICALILTVPAYLANLGDMGLRTVVFEPISIACLACLLPGPRAIPPMLDRASRYLLAISMIIFGVDHFLGLTFIASLLPNWIPWHVFWVAFFGVVFIAAGIGIAVNVLLRWAAAGLGLMFGIWVLSLHLPRVFGWYGIPGATRNPDEYSSLFIAVALWGGLWGLARVSSPEPR